MHRKINVCTHRRFQETTSIQVPQNNIIEHILVSVAIAFVGSTYFSAVHWFALSQCCRRRPRLCWSLFWSRRQLKKWYVSLFSRRCRWSVFDPGYFLDTTFSAWLVNYSMQVSTCCRRSNNSFRCFNNSQFSVSQCQLPLKGRDTFLETWD